MKSPHDAARSARIAAGAPTIRRAAAALAVLAALAVAVPAPAQEDPDEFPVRVQVASLPAVVHPGGTVDIPIDVVNTGPDSYPDIQVRLYVGPRVETRSALRDPDRPNGIGHVVELTQDTELSPNATLRLPLSAAVDELPRLAAGRTGVYPLGIEVRARLRGSRRPIARADTYLQLWPAGAPRVRTPIAWVWPLVETPRRDGDGVYPDESLAESLMKGSGRLARLLDTAADSRTPVTWALDPALVTAARDLADGYRVRDGDEVADGEWRESAAAWFERLDRAVADRADEVLAVPYADPDVVALVRHGAGTVASAANRAGREALATGGISVDPTLAWPAGGLVDTAGLDAYAAAGARYLVLAEEVLVRPERNYTPHAATTLRRAGDLTGLVVDGVLEDLVEGPGEAGNAVAVQRFLAETAVIALEQPNRLRGLVVAPPHRRWDPAAGFAELLLEQTAAAPWLAPVGLRDMAAVRDPEPAGEDDEQFLSYPPGAPELPRGYLDEVGQARGQLGLYEAILPRENDDRLPAVVSEQLLRAVSVRWRGERDGGLALAEDVRRRLAAQFAKIRVSTGGLITMTSETGRIPITVINELDQTVRVRVRIEATARLEIDSAPVEQTIPPGRTQLTISGTARQGGEFTITVSLLTPDGNALPGSAVLRVRSTAYGRVALVITVGAFAVLLVAGVVRVVRRRRRTAAA